MFSIQLVYKLVIISARSSDQFEESKKYFRKKRQHLLQKIIKFFFINLLNFYFKTYFLSIIEYIKVKNVNSHKITGYDSQPNITYS